MAYHKDEYYDSEVTSGLAQAYKQSLALLGEDPDREGLEKTPERVAKAMQYLTQGYQQNAVKILNSAKFHEDVSEMVIVKDIELYSLCEHHMLPFVGKAHVAYIPNGYITGLSKIARVVDVYARRLQVQERLTTQILEAIESALKPLGVAVVIEASHFCMMMRGVSKQNSVTTTSSFSGEFRNETTRSEFLRLIASDLR
jgi:GTP cyclohydrolase IA